MHDVRVGLVQVPQGDPTQVYLSIPRLRGALRASGHEDVVVRDLNLDAYSYFLTEDQIAAAAGRCEARLRELDELPQLGPRAADEFFALVQGLAAAGPAARHVAEALAVMRSSERFYDLQDYAWAWSILDSSFRILSAAHHPSMWSMFDFHTDRDPERFDDLMEVVANPRSVLFTEFFEAEALPWIAQQQLDLLGISIIYTSQVIPGLILASLAKAQDPELRIVLGGPAIAQIASAMADAGLRFPFVDAVVYSEGESALVALVERLKQGSSTFDGVPNLIWWAPEERSAHVEPLVIEDLAKLPTPDFSGLPFSRYLSPRPVVMLDVTRGCYWGKCAFCAYGISPETLQAYREMSVDRIQADLRELSEVCGTDSFMFSVDVLSPSLVRRLSERLAREGPPVKWMGDMRFERTVDETLCRLMYEGGCRFISMGLESSVQRVADCMDKGTREEDLDRILRAFRAADIGVNTQFFLGFPTETREEAQATVDFVLDHSDTINTLGCGTFHVCRGSAVEREPDNFGVARLDRGGPDNLSPTLDFVPTSGLAPDEADALLRQSRRALSSVFPTTRNMSLLIGAHALLHLARLGAAGFDEVIRPAMASPPRRRGSNGHGNGQGEGTVELEAWTALFELHHDLYEIIAERRRGTHRAQTTWTRRAQPIPALYDGHQHRCCRLSSRQHALLRELPGPTPPSALEHQLPHLPNAWIRDTLKSLNRAGFIYMGGDAIVGAQE